MKKWLLFGLAVLGVATFLYAQTNPFFIVQNPRGIHITAGTQFPSEATMGYPPADGWIHIDLGEGTTNPVTYIYSASSTAWVAFSPVGTALGVVPSTFAGNTIDVADSVWGGQSQLSFEGATADGFEMDVEAADVGQDQDVYIGDIGEADGSFLLSTLDDADVDDANAVWGAANSIVFEGVTADANEMQLVPRDPLRDSTITFGGETDGVVMTSRVSDEGYALRDAVSNPWRQDFRYDMGNCIALLDDHTAVAGAADTNENNVVCNMASFEFWVEQACAGGVAGLLTPDPDGWLIETDDTNDEGIQGILFGGDDDYNTGWHLAAQTDAGYFEARIIISDSSETDQVLFGFLVREAYSADAEEDAFDTYCLVGVDDAAADPRDIVIAEELNGGGGANTDTLADVVDGTAFTIRVVLEAAGTVDVYIDGVLTNDNVVTFDAADFVVPYFSVINSAGDGTPDPDVYVQYVEVGYLN